MTKKSDRKSRNPEATRKKILEVAFMEVFRRGFQGVSVADIVAKTGLTKGAFFHHFPTKERLGHALIDETLRRMVLERWVLPLDEYENAVEGVVANFKQKTDSMSDDSLSLGCPLNNLVQEMSGVDSVFRNKLREVLELWIAGVEKNLKKSQTRGYLKEDANPRRLAEFIVMNQEGAFGMMKSMRDRKAFRSLHASLKDYLQTVQTRKGASA